MNTINVVGRLGKDATVIESNGSRFMSMTVATDEYNGKDNETIWYNVTYSGNGMDRLAEFLKKGRLIFITGALKPRKYADREGRQQTALDIRAFHIDFIRIAQQNQQGDETKPIAEPTTGQIPAEPTQTPAPPAAPSFPPSQSSNLDGNVADSDLPF